LKISDTYEAIYKGHYSREQARFIIFLKEGFDKVDLYLSLLYGYLCEEIY